LITITDMGIHLMDDKSKNPQEVVVPWENIAKARLEVSF